MGKRRGTEYEGVPNIVPGGQSIPLKTVVRPIGGGGGNPPVSDHDKGEQYWTVTDAGVTSNESGNNIALKDVSTVNPAFQGLGYEFPGLASPADINAWTIDWAVPKNYAGNAKLRLYLLATGPGSC